MASIEEHVRTAVRLAADNVAAGQFPFAAVVVADGGAGDVLGTGVNTCRRDADPTAHGEVEAMRDACRRLGSFDLSGAVVASSCHPCPICQAVAGATGIERIYYAATRDQAAAGGFGMPERAASPSTSMACSCRSNASWSRTPRVRSMRGLRAGTTPTPCVGPCTSYAWR